jgi:hypothetical protein
MHGWRQKGREEKGRGEEAVLRSALDRCACAESDPRWTDIDRERLAGQTRDGRVGERRPR